MNAQKVIGGVTQVLTRAGQVVPFVVNKVVFPGIYWSKVAKEVAKEVWLKEKMNPPSIAEIQNVFSRLRSQLPKEFKEKTNNMTFKKFVEEAKAVTGKQAAGVAIAGLQIFGFFSVGEMIGRRGVLGYHIKA